MTHPPPAPGSHGPASSRQSGLPVLLLAVGLGLLVLLLAVGAVVNVRVNQPGLFEPDRQERLAEPGEHGVSKQQYADSAAAVADSQAAFRAVADASDDYYLALTGSGEASLAGGDALLSSLDTAAATLDALPAGADPEVAARVAGYDEAFESYRAEVRALVEESASFAEVAPCHPAELGSLDPAAASTGELLDECGGALTGLAQGDSPLARVAGDSLVYLTAWSVAVDTDDAEAADDLRSQYQAVFLTAVQFAQSGVTRVYEPVGAEATDVATYCDRAADLPAGT